MLKVTQILVLLLALTACGGGSSTPAVEDAVQNYSDAFLTGDAGAAYAMLSSQCQSTIGQATFDAVVKAAGKTFGKAQLFDTFSSKVSGDSATVTYTYASTPAIDQKDQAWTLADGSWRYDAC